MTETVGIDRPSVAKPLSRPRSSATSRPTFLPQVDRANRPCHHEPAYACPKAKEFPRDLAAGLSLADSGVAGLCITCQLPPVTGSASFHHGRSFAFRLSRNLASYSWGCFPNNGVRHVSVKDRTA